METEIWKGVPGFPGYEVSNLGRTRSYKGTGGKHNGPVTTPRIIAAAPNSKGYMIHSFLNGKKRKSFTLHRLVAELFVEGFAPGKECSHLDGVRANCRADNLRWETHRENMHRQEGHGTLMLGDRNHKSKLTQEQADSVIPRHNAGESLSEIGREFGVTPQSIWSIYHGDNWRRRASKKEKN